MFWSPLACSTREIFRDLTDWLTPSITHSSSITFPPAMQLKDVTMFCCDIFIGTYSLPSKTKLLLKSPPNRMEMFENSLKSCARVLCKFSDGVLPPNICFVYPAAVYWADIDIHRQSLARHSHSPILDKLPGVFTDQVDFWTLGPWRIMLLSFRFLEKVGIKKHRVVFYTQAFASP